MHGNARFESAESLSLQVEESVDISIQPVRVCRQVQTVGEGTHVPIPGVEFSLFFICFLFLPVSSLCFCQLVSRCSKCLSEKGKKRKNKARLPAMKERVGTF